MKTQRVMAQRSFGKELVATAMVWLAGALAAQAWDLTVYVSPGAGGAVNSTTPIYTKTGLTTNQAWQLLAVANTDYQFSSWTSFDDFQYSPGNSTTNFVRIKSTNNTDVAIFANFVSTIPIYSLTVTKGPGGLSTSPTGTTTYARGTVKTISATPSNSPPNFFIFDQWIGDIAGIGSAYSNNTTITIDDNKSIQATFKQRFTYTSYEPLGPSSGSIGTNVVEGTSYVAQPLQNPAPSSTSGKRYACIGWTGGYGDIPLTSAASSYSVLSASSTSSNRWSWTNEYNLTIEADTGYNTVGGSVSGGGTVTLGASNWVVQGATVTLTATARAGYDFLGWEVNSTGAVPPGALTIVMVGPTRVVAQFLAQGADSAWIKWKKEFGLNTASDVGEDGRNGDPDRDGLSNWEEFQLQNTNRNWKTSPINADSDGDGMDDYYERYSVDPTNSQSTVQNREFVTAAFDNGSYDLDNGPNGNRDEDYHWSTNDGYQVSLKLTNIEEWRGPDGLAPVIYTNVTYGNPLYPFSDDRGKTVRMALPNRPPYNLVNPDTFDQSKSNTSDSDKDTLDDGFEFSWDQWQRNNSGMEEIFEIGVVNGVSTTITNTVPVWDGEVNGTRVFNPATPNVDRFSGGPDYDVLYEYQSGKVSIHYYDTVREYNAWKADAFSASAAGAPHSIRMDNPPPTDTVTKRCSHPFLIDVDQDGLPDGYEVIFGYDPWNASTPGSLGTDGADSPDGDWMAKDGTNALALRNNEIYVRDGFDPRVSIDRTYPVAKTMPGPGTAVSPTTQRYSNIDEMRGPDGMMMIVPSPESDDATNPLNYDTDGDGIWDGWENYVGLNPNEPLDAAPNPDDDKLSNLEEFQSFYTSSTNRGALVPLASWMNKIFPTDPNDADTDGERIKDGDEKTLFNGTSASVTNTVIDDDGNVISQAFAAGVWNGKCYTGGGLNPTSSDTDDDTMPDPYEGGYSAPLDGTVGDAFNDPDLDKLPNYLEYYSTAVYHWQYDAWVDGQPAYNSGDFFDGTPKKWDWVQRLYVPALGPKLNAYAYSGSNPVLVDSDWDGMDDYYEAFHGLNPTYGIIDLISSRDAGGPILVDGVFLPFVADPRVLPYVNGSSMMDSDGDGLPNSTEAANYSGTWQTSPGHHTDPTPLWMTDTGDTRSWANLYYTPGSIWYWSGPLPPPIYAFDFESNEGFDTDNDGYSDLEELNTTQTDPLSPERPVKRRALYFPEGVSAFARTEPSMVPSRINSSRDYITGLTVEDTFRSFTVEAWVRPINPASGDDQVVVERPVYLPEGNPMMLDAGLRLNFRLGIDADGLPYVAYTGEGQQIVFYEAKASSASRLSATNWTHLCGTYQVPSATDPDHRGVLSLYVNGQLVSQTNPNELPSIGEFGTGGTIVSFPGPIIVGAADETPARSLSNPLITTKYFKGWIDEVRIWDGARSADAVQGSMKTRMKQKDVLANSEPLIRPQLLALYDCDNLPDPDHSATAPAGIGFDLTGTAIYPPAWSYVGFWGAAPDHSMVYSDYRYLPWIENAASHTPVVPAYDVGDPAGVVNLMSGTNVVGQTVNFPNSWDPYGWKHYTAPALPFEVFVQVNDMLPMGWMQADEDVPMWDNGTVPATTPFDSDGDGLPDGYEEAYGLNPMDAKGANGANGDADNDGISNIAEYRAGTNPKMFDSDGDGFGDYDSRQGPGFRTYGELYDDGDGIPDQWEEEYQRICPSTGKAGLDPAKYDADKDPDEDGWSNYGEYMGSWRAYIAMATSNGAGFVANTNNMVMVPHCDPLDSSRYPEPLVALHVRYNGRLGSSLENALTGNRDVRISIYHSASMDGYPDATLNLMQDTDGDGIPQWWNGRYNTSGAAADPDGDLLNNQQEYVHGTDPWNPDTDGDGISDLGDYSASENQSGAVVRQFTTGHIHEGNNYVFAYMDLNNDNQWQPDVEPAGIGQFQPLNLGWSDVNNVEIGLSDALSGYPRFAWPAVANVSRYVVTNMTVPAVGKVINAPRNYWHEGDWLNVGTYGAPTGTVVMIIYTNEAPNGYYTNLSAMVSGGSLATPTVATPHDSVLPYARNEIEFRVDANATSYRLQVALSSNGTSILSTTNIVPFRDLNGICKAPLPFYAGDNYATSATSFASSTWTNARYWVRVQAATPALSALSAWSAVNINVQPPTGSSMISGDVYYFGKVSHGYGTSQASNLAVIVQAFQSAGFSGVADAQVQVTYQCNTNAPSARKGGYNLKGLKNGTYYVRAFIDENGNRTLDPWEPMGFAWLPLNDGTGGYAPQAVDLSGTAGVGKDGVRIVIRDRDTDDDQLPDGWEWMYYGNLAKGAYDIGSNTLTLLRNYEIEPADLDPTKNDYDGDGALDTIEIDWTHASLGLPMDPAHIYNPYDPISNPSGTDLNPTKWDTDGDGLSDGYEISHGLNPLNPADGAAKIAAARAAGEVIPGIPAISQIAAVTPDAGQFSLTWLGQMGMSYEVQVSDDLKTWLTAPNGSRYGAAMHTYVDQSPKVTTRFYRVVVK